MLGCPRYSVSIVGFRLPQGWILQDRFGSNPWLGIFTHDPLVHSRKLCFSAFRIRPCPQYSNRFRHFHLLRRNVSIHDRNISIHGRSYQEELSMYMYVCGRSGMQTKSSKSGQSSTLDCCALAFQKLPPGPQFQILCAFPNQASLVNT